jgi:hypothetical protein
MEHEQSNNGKSERFMENLLRPYIFIRPLEMLIQLAEGIRRRCARQGSMQAGQPNPLRINNAASSLITKGYALAVLRFSPPARYS